MQYMDGFQGKGVPFVVRVTEKGVALPEFDCKMVKLDNWNLQSDLLTGNDIEVYWGFEGNYVHRLVAGGNTDYIWVSNSSQITLRTKPGEVVDVYGSVLM